MIQDGAQGEADAFAGGHIADAMVPEVPDEEHGLVPGAARQQVPQKLQALVTIADDLPKRLGVQLDGPRRLPSPANGRLVRVIRVVIGLAGQGHDANLFDGFCELGRPVDVPFPVFYLEGLELGDHVLELDHAPAHQQGCCPVKPIGDRLVAGQPESEEFHRLVDAKGVDQVNKSLVFRPSREHVQDDARDAVRIQVKVPNQRLDLRKDTVQVVLGYFGLLRLI